MMDFAARTQLEIVSKENRVQGNNLYSFFSLDFLKHYKIYTFGDYKGIKMSFRSVRQFCGSPKPMWLVAPCLQPGYKSVIVCLQSHLLAYNKDICRRVLCLSMSEANNSVFLYGGLLVMWDSRTDGQTFFNYKIRQMA